MENNNTTLGKFFYQQRLKTTKEIEKRTIQELKSKGNSEKISFNAPISSKAKPSNLRVIQYNIMNAIETNNLALFIDLGGHDRIDLNFYAKYESQRIKNMDDNPSGEQS